MPKKTSFWKPTSSINHWISTLLPVVWTSTLIFMMSQMALYSDQVRNLGALFGPLAPGVFPHSTASIVASRPMSHSRKKLYSGSAIDLPSPLYSVHSDVQKTSLPVEMKYAFPSPQRPRMLTLYLSIVGLV